MNPRAMAIAGLAIVVDPTAGVRPPAGSGVPFSDERSASLAEASGATVARTPRSELVAEELGSLSRAVAEYAVQFVGRVGSAGSCEVSKKAVARLTELVRDLPTRLEVYVQAFCELESSGALTPRSGLSTGDYNERLRKALRNVEPSCVRGDIDAVVAFADALGRESGNTRGPSGRNLPAAMRWMMEAFLERHDMPPRVFFK